MTRSFDVAECFLSAILKLLKKNFHHSGTLFMVVLSKKKYFLFYFSSKWNKYFFPKYPSPPISKNILIPNFKSLVLGDEYKSSALNDSLPITAYRKGKSPKAYLVTSSYKSATRRPLLFTYAHGTISKRTVWESDEVAGPANVFKLKIVLLVSQKASSSCGLKTLKNG